MEYYGTLGPSCRDPRVLRAMFQNGMTGMRMNLSHGSLREHEKWLRAMWEAALAERMNCRLLIDLQGPELRIGTLPQPVELTEGSEVILGTGLIKIPRVVYSYAKKGSSLLLDDGKILLRVLENSGEYLNCEVVRGGVLRSSKSIAMPDSGIHPPTLTDQDRRNIKDAAMYGVTGVMLPFVRGKEDLIELRKALEEANAPQIQIYAKLEDRRGVEALPKLLNYADSFVIARGDLGNDMPLWELPRVQKETAKILREAGKPFMIVTQMLESMHASAVPTRAEVCDIFNAVLDGAAAVMLTGETAVGRFPAEAMRYLVQTGEEARAYIEEQRQKKEAEEKKIGYWSRAM